MSVPRIEHSMLSSILTGKQPSDFVCIQDSLKQSGLHLLKAFAQHAVDSRENHVHILCYEHSTRKMKSGLRNICEDYVHFHDCFTDHRGWIESREKENLKCDVQAKDNSVLSVLKYSPVTSTNGCIVIIDSLTPLIYSVGFTRCYREFHSLLARSTKGVTVSQVVCLVHEDTLPDAHVTLPQLCHLATSSIRIGPSTPLSRGNPIASVTHKKQGGKVVRHVECYSVDTDNKVKIEVLTEVMPTNIGVNKDVGEDSDLPHDLTTFKLSLGQQEREARSQLVLPYLRVNSEKGGRVFYQPDAADDLDEEDPDDDLDI